MPAIALPRLIAEKFDDLSQQVRRIWFWRGVSRVVLIAVVAAVAILLADRALGFSTPVRTLASLAWLVVVGLAILRFIVRPQRRPLTTETLAAAIETQFPSLSERLMTLVELSQDPDGGHGSKPFKDLLVKETARRTKRLNFDRAAPRGPVIRLALVAGAFAAFVVLSTLFLTGGTDRVARFLLPWRTPRVEAPFAIKVSSGSVVVKRGEPVTLTAYLEKLQPEAVLPATAALVARDADGEKKLPMTGDVQAAFALTRPAVTADFEYRVEAGNASSEWFRVTAADPVELAEGTSAVVVPPEYASPPLVKTTVLGFAALGGLQYSQVQFSFKFNRPAAGASLEWISGGLTTVEGERLKISLAEDRRSATATMPLTASGSYRLRLTGEHGVTTTQTAAANVGIDQPPRFEKAVGIGERAKEVRPDETIILDVAAVDDFKIDALVLEYAVNGGKPQEMAIKVREPGTARADGKHVFALAGLVKEGDTLIYRLRATDNRRTGVLTPQATFFPEKVWATLKISSRADSLDQQDILSQRDELKKKLSAAEALANDARQEVEKVRRDLGDKPMLTAEQVARRQAARDAAVLAAETLDEAAKEAALTPELRSLADAMRSTAQDLLRSADDKLRRSENESNVKNRNESFTAAEAQLNAARDKIAAMKKGNDDLARNRLDKRRLEKLSDAVDRLSKKAAEAGPADRDELLNRLQQAKDELRDVINGNETLKSGADRAKNEQAKKLADEAAALKEAEKKLDADVAEAEATARKKALADAAAKQAELNKKADALRGAAKPADEAALAKTPFDDATKKLQDGDAVAAMTGQEKAARDLDRLTESIAKAAAERRDAKAAVLQLAKLQDELGKKLQEAVKKESNAEMRRIAENQRSLAEAAARISAPPNDPNSAQAKNQALARLTEARDAVAENPAEAGAAQQAAADALRKFAESLPAHEKRMQAAKAELEKLQREQAALEAETENKLRPFERRKPDDEAQRELAEKLKKQVEKQEEMAEKLRGLDAPGFESRRDRTVEAAKSAADDLRTGRPQDIPASQADLKRRMAQLRAALDGGAPGDAVADELARKQNAIADRLAKSPETAAELGKLQRELAEKLGGLFDPDAAERIARAKQAVQDAAKQFQKPDEVDELRKKTKQAAKELDELADSLAGVESDRQRVERLAKQRKEQAEWSKANGTKVTSDAQAAAAASELERDLADLKQTRAGAAQEAKKDAIEKLEKLKATPKAERASGLQQAAAESLEKLAKAMQGESKPGERAKHEGDTSGDAGGQLPSAADAAKARELAREQREIRDAAAKDAGKAEPDPKKVAEQAEQQKKLAGQAETLAKGMDSASHAPTNSGDAANSLTQGAEAAKKAKEAMEKAAREQSAGRAAGAGEARQDAMKALDDAQAKAKSAAGAAAGAADPKAAAASKSAGEANDLLREAGQNQKAAGEALKKASEKIGEAADKLGEAGQQAPGPPGGNTGTTPKPLTAADLPPDLQQYVGKSWGELPGEVRARLVQDLKAKYGEDYARVIKLYFEQLAEKK